MKYKLHQLFHTILSHSSKRMLLVVKKGREFETKDEDDEGERW